MAVRSCAVCTARFAGRVDAIYCSPACRQKAHRRRSAPTGNQRAAAPLIERARAAQRRSRELVGAASRSRHEVAIAAQQREQDRHRLLDYGAGTAQRW